MNPRKRNLNEPIVTYPNKRCRTTSAYSSDSENEESPGITRRVSNFFKNTIFDSSIYRRVSSMFNYTRQNEEINGEPTAENSDEEEDENSTPHASLTNFKNSIEHGASFPSHSEERSDFMTEERTTNSSKITHIPFSLLSSNPFPKRNSTFSRRESNFSSISRKDGPTNIFLPVPIVKNKSKTPSKIFRSDSKLFKQTKSSLNGDRSLPLRRHYTHNGKSYCNKYLSTVQQSIRLEERERYKQLLQQYTAVPLGSNPNNSSLRSSRSSSISSVSEITNNHSKDASVQSSGSQSPITRSTLSRDYSDQLRRRLLKLSESISKTYPTPNSIFATRPDKSPIIIDVQNHPTSSKIRPDDDDDDDDEDDDVQIIESKSPKKKVSSFPVISTRDKLKTKTRDCVFFSSEWTSDLKKELERKSSELKPLIEVAEIETAALKKAREERNELYRKQLRQRFQKFHKLSYHEIEEIKPEPTEEAFVELTEEMEARIDEALVPSPPDQLLVEGFNLTIRRRDIETLAGLNWLNDEVINFYLNLLVDRGKMENYPSVYAFNTFFYPKVMSAGHSALKRWTRKVDIFSYQFIVIPVHLGMHWCLAVIDFSKKEIRYYDSLGDKNMECLKALQVYLCDESVDKKKQKFDTSDWSLTIPKDIPQQMNGSDCGMFACIYAEYITREAEITFSQEDMPYFRRRMVYEILTKKLL